MTTNERSSFDGLSALKLGLLGGIIAIYLSLVGLVEAFGESDIIGGVIAFGHTMLLLTVFGIGFITARRVTSATSLSMQTLKRVFIRTGTASFSITAVTRCGVS